MTFSSVPSTLVSVAVSDLDEKYASVVFTVDTTVLFSIDLEKSHYPVSLLASDPFLLLQILMTPYPHIAIIDEWLATTKDMDPDSFVLGSVRFEDLVTRSKTILNPPQS